MWKFSVVEIPAWPTGGLGTCMARLRRSVGRWAFPPAEGFPHGGKVVVLGLTRYGPTKTHRATDQKKNLLFVNGEGFLLKCFI